MTVQLYLNTPQLFIQGDGEPLIFQIKGWLDADVLGGVITEKLPVQISGFTHLKYSPQDQAIFFADIEHLKAKLDLQLALFKNMIEESFQRALLQELNDLPVISLEKTPELKSLLADMMKNNHPADIRFSVQNSELVVEAAAGVY